MRAFLFPGQGSQAIGMGKELYDNFHSAKVVFEEVSEAVGFNLKMIIFEGPEAVLTSTENAQPAIMCCSMAILRVLENDFNFAIEKHVDYVAGHSLGEYSALCATQTFDLRTVANLLKIRGVAMKSCTPEGYSGMVAILGINDINKIKQLIEEVKLPNEVCVIANDNCLGQTVVSGHMKSMENIVAKAKDFGAKIAVKLPVSGSFHSPLMRKASEIMADSLNNVQMNDSYIPLISNVLAEEIIDKDHIRTLLVEQIVSGVRWRESMEYLVNKGVDEIVEVGNGNILSGLMKRISPDVNRVNLESIADIEGFINNLKSV